MNEHEKFPMRVLYFSVKNMTKVFGFCLFVWLVWLVGWCVG
jgi:hypothetical protein